MKPIATDPASPLAIRSALKAAISANRSKRRASGRKVRPAPVRRTERLVRSKRPTSVERVLEELDLPA